jgi:beta-glucosidase
MTGIHEDIRALESRVAYWLDQLTLDEKFALCSGRNFWETRPVPRLGIAPFRVTDGPRGVAWHSARGRHTAFPSGIALAASWDPALARDFGRALGAETRRAGRQMILGPAVNICRTPLNGRTFEYFTEDPALNRSLAVAVVQGIQEQGVAACIKHYAANNQETRRMKNSSEVSERALREIYLPAFEGAVRDADAWSVMAAYNAVNGIPACEHSDLLTTKLHDEWGFRGVVVSDWFAARRTSSSGACVHAGLGLEMPGKGSRYRPRALREAFARNEFTAAQLDHNLAGLLRVMLLTGHLDEGRYASPVVPNAPDSRQVARRMAAEGMVLLKNDNATLPLNEDKLRRIAVLGPKADRRNCLPLWGGSSGVWPPGEVTPLAGLHQRLGDRVEIVREPRGADVVLLFLGLSHRPGSDSEVMDRKSLSLPAKQLRLLEKVRRRNARVVVVLINGGPLSMDWADNVPAILEAWYPGMEGGHAIADVLLGDVNPCGKLPVTFPAALADCPAHRSPATYPGDATTVRYAEDIFVGYRHFDRNGIAPRFPFGHGLSYTCFDYSALTLDQAQLAMPGKLQVSVQLDNSGDRPGAEVVQLYVAHDDPPVERPPRELKRVAKCFLQPGEHTRIMFELGYRDFAWFCEKRRTWHLAPGHFRIEIGASSRDIRLTSPLCIASVNSN